jgi:hypothetical protein
MDLTNLTMVELYKLGFLTNQSRTISHGKAGNYAEEIFREVIVELRERGIDTWEELICIIEDVAQANSPLRALDDEDLRLMEQVLFMAFNSGKVSKRGAPVGKGEIPRQGILNLMIRVELCQAEDIEDL